MKKCASKKAKDNFGELLDTAQREPVTIEKRGRAVAVVLSLEEYKRMEATEDAFWAMKARKASEKGFIGNKESEKLIEDILNAED